MPRLIAIAGAVLFVMQAAPALSSTAGLQAQGYAFALAMPDGRVLASRDLVGAVMEMDDPYGRVVTARIDQVTPSKERADILLHELSVLNPATGAWGPMCDADIYGRRAAFPVPGRWDAKRHFIKDASQWFLTCTAGSQGKCILWGYDPWRKGPHGEDLAAYYQACQHMVPADYQGNGVPHTRNGTDIDVWDAAAVQTPDTNADPSFAFEAGWNADGAVCVARTRWANLLPVNILLQSAPNLAAHPCDEAEARHRGAILFNRSRLAPVAHAPAGL
ncbi:MAG: ADYC domain-containing protein [Rhizomicrobium sp.]|jgi:hypothetical protein